MGRNNRKMRALQRGIMYAHGKRGGSLPLTRMRCESKRYNVWSIEHPYPHWALVAFWNGFEQSDEAKRLVAEYDARVAAHGNPFRPLPAPSPTPPEAKE